jgi:hypothetical protein
MQTLGLSSESQRSDGWLKSLLWPTVDNAWDVDYLGQQGMWLCTVVAVFGLGFSFLTGNPVVIGVSMISALFFILGGMGIREASWPAAALLFAVQLCNVLLQPGFFTVAFTVILLSNLRATFLASEWRPAAEGEDRPTRFSETIRDKYVDQLPPILWPKLQIPFFVLGGAILLLSLLGVLYTVAVALGLIPHKS